MDQTPIDRLKLVLNRAQSGGELERETSTLGILLLGVGGIIGSGIFVLVGHAAAISAGPAIVLSFLVSGMAALLAATCYVTAARIVPVAGGVFTYAYVGLGELAGWIVGWDLQLEYLVGNALVCVGWAAYFSSFLRDVFGVYLPSYLLDAPLKWNPHSHVLSSTGAFANVPAMAITLLVTGVLCLGLRETTRINAVVVTIKLSVILLFILLVGRFIHLQNLTPFIPQNSGKFGEFGWSGILHGAELVFFSYVGFDAMATTGQEVKNPERSLPIALFATLAICALVYTVVAVVLVGVVPYQELGVGNPLAVAVEKTSYQGLRWVVESGALIGLTSSIALGLIAQPRISLAMAQNGLFPKAFSRVSGKRQSPVFGTLVFGSATAMLAGFVPFQILNELVSVGALFGFSAVSLAVIGLSRGELKNKIRTISLILSYISLSVFGGLLLLSGWSGFFRITIWLLIGLCVKRYFNNQLLPILKSP